MNKIILFVRKGKQDFLLLGLCIKKTTEFNRLFEKWLMLKLCLLPTAEKQWLFLAILPIDKKKSTE